MVEQRSPKPSVACSSRVSPAKRSPLGLLFFAVFRESNTQRNRDGTTFRALVVAFDTTLCKYNLRALLYLLLLHIKEKRRLASAFLFMQCDIFLCDRAASILRSSTAGW